MMNQKILLTIVYTFAFSANLGSAQYTLCTQYACCSTGASSSSCVDKNNMHLSFNETLSTMTVSGKQSGNAWSSQMLSFQMQQKGNAWMGQCEVALGLGLAVPCSDCSYSSCLWCSSNCCSCTSDMSALTAIWHTNASRPSSDVEFLVPTAVSPKRNLQSVSYLLCKDGDCCTTNANMSYPTCSLGDDTIQFLEEQALLTFGTNSLNTLYFKLQMLQRSNNTWSNSFTFQGSGSTSCGCSFSCSPFTSTGTCSGDFSTDGASALNATKYVFNMPSALAGAVSTFI